MEKDKVYKLTALMKEGAGSDHLRVGVRLPNGQYELPLKHRIFTSKNRFQGSTIYRKYLHKNRIGGPSSNGFYKVESQPCNFSPKHFRVDLAPVTF